MAILSLLLGIIGGAIVGGLMVLADKFGFYLIIVVPIIGGSIIGFFVALPYLNRGATAVATSPAYGLGGGLAGPMVIDNRPSRMQVIIIAILGTLVATAIYWGGSYIMMRQDIVTSLQEEDPTFTPEEVYALLDEYYDTEYGTTGFVGFLQDVAAEGISINRTGRDSGGFTLKDGMAYAYWGVEILLMALFAIMSALSRARALPEPETVDVAENPTVS